MDYYPDVWGPHPHGEYVSDIEHLKDQYGYDRSRPIPVLAGEILASGMVPILRASYQTQLGSKRMYQAFRNNVAESFYSNIAKLHQHGISPMLLSLRYSFWGPNQEGKWLYGPWEVGKYVGNRWRWEATRLRVPVVWPAIAGPGPKICEHGASILVGTVNWWDPTRPLASLNVVYQRTREANAAVRSKAGDLPDTPLLRAGEILVIVRRGGEPVAGATVWILPGGGQSAYPRAIRTASDGRAWFVTPEPGKWVILVEDDGTRKASVIEAKPTPLGGPGYAHLLVTKFEL